MKVKKSEIQLLIAVIGVLIAVCTYFLVYSKFNEKSDALEAENATLSSQVATLEILDQRKADYIEATGKMQSYITNFENRFPADILPEDDCGCNSSHGYDSNRCCGRYHSSCRNDGSKSGFYGRYCLCRYPYV